MSFQLLKEEIMDPGLCQGCGLCSGSCKHIILVDLKPELDDYCVLEREGIACGKCYAICPQVNQSECEPKVPLAMYALKSTDPEIRDDAASGGFVTTLNKFLLENQKVSHLVEVQTTNDKPISVISTDFKDVRKYSGVLYGRSGVLEKLTQVMGDPDHEQIGIVGVPCEITGAAAMELEMKADMFKIGLFCNANIKGGESEDDIVYSPCKRSCPAGVDASGYINHIRHGNYQAAVDLIRETNPLPSVCGRVCTHECEYNCTLIGTNNPIAIRELKKFITDWEMNNIPKPTKSSTPQTGQKIAVIGSGPSGLTSAYFLANMGYKPTIFEKSDKVGGMLRFGVPKFRLPDHVIDHDIENIVAVGVEIKLNSSIGPELTFDDLKTQGFEAIYVAIGQYEPLTLHLEGEDLPNVHTAIEFLVDRKYRYWENTDEFKDKTIGILGGGPVAIDVAQTALRLGAKKAIMVEIRNEDQLKMARDDIPENEIEFIEYKYDTNTKKFTNYANGMLVFNCYKVSQEKGENGRTKFVKIEGSDYEFEVDAVVIAIGQTVEAKYLDGASKNQLKKNRNKIIVDEVTFETNIPGVFAGGDIIERGKNVAVAAIAHGREAAYSIDRYLRGVDLKEGRVNRSKMFFHPILPPLDTSIKPPTENGMQTIWRNFEEIDGIFDEAMAIKEANRCFNCNHYCTHCQDFAAINADITAGEIGSDKDFTTVLVWTEKGHEIVKDLINQSLLTEGKVTQEAIDLAISKKMKREIIKHEIAPRDKVYKCIQLNKANTISAISKELELSPKDVRFHSLRLVQKGKISMKLEEEEPVFSIISEE
jgi:NADPH-dependent glutamate synthase beta subunit-like oxidoreductase